MAFDGVGYYYGLFKGRLTLKSKQLPDEVEGENLQGFDQGLGRRLWYATKGNVDEVNALLQSFSPNRHADLFRGIGIACAYVGGNEESDLKCLLKISGEHYKQLQTGVLLAAVSRIASNTVNTSINNACQIICNKTVNELRMGLMNTTTNFFYLYNKGAANNLWLTQLQSELLQNS